MRISNTRYVYQQKMNCNLHGLFQDPKSKPRANRRQCISNTFGDPDLTNTFGDPNLTTGTTTKIVISNGSELASTPVLEPIPITQC
jgi:hypothetical protein